MFSAARKLNTKYLEIQDDVDQLCIDLPNGSKIEIQKTGKDYRINWRGELKILGSIVASGTEAPSHDKSIASEQQLG